MTSDRSRDGSGAEATRSLVMPSISRPSRSNAQPTISPTRACLLQRLQFGLGDEAIDVERRLGPRSPMPTKVTSACAARASVGWIIGWPCSISRSSAEDAMTGRGMGKLRALIVGDVEDDVVEGGRAVRRDVAGQRHDLVLRALHRRSCSIAALSVRPVPIAMTIGSGDFSRRSISAAAASAMPIVVDADVRIARNHLDEIEGKARLQPAASSRQRRSGDRAGP